MTSDRPVRLGVAGLGRAFMLMLPSFENDPRVVLAACAAPRESSRDAFVQRFGGVAYDSVEALCADPTLDAIYIATPHQMHRSHAECAVSSGKHVLLDKPLCVTLEDGEAIAEAAERAGKIVIVGPSHSFDAPVLKARALIDSGSIGHVRMINALNYTDFLYRPRRPEELVTAEGGGVIFSQGVHQIDIVRLLGGGMVSTVRASTGQWDDKRPTECAYSAHLTFAEGAFASLTYSGFAHFNSDEFCDWIGELGHDTDPKAYGKARKALQSVQTPQDEIRLKTERTFGASPDPAFPDHNEHFGTILVSCDGADLRLTPDGVWIYGHTQRDFVPTPLGTIPRKGVMDALAAVVNEGQAPVQDARWGLASLEVCHGIIQSSANGKEISLEHQVPVRSLQERKQRI
ncbi:MAG: Gfo/Idh/MocA family oxidoreductase [Alphaproteobacteria bacterium]|nr:Gfo/Idh/MocA family oxidoreductase [Alphaproteobacteria bacterium]